MHDFHAVVYRFSRRGEQQSLSSSEFNLSHLPQSLSAISPQSLLAISLQSLSSSGVVNSNLSHLPNLKRRVLFCLDGIVLHARRRFRLGDGAWKLDPNTPDGRKQHRASRARRLGPHIDARCPTRAHRQTCASFPGATRMPARAFFCSSCPRTWRMRARSRPPLKAGGVFKGGWRFLVALCSSCRKGFEGGCPPLRAGTRSFGTTTRRRRHP